MDKKNKLILTVLAVLTLFIALIGATFAYFSAVSQSKPQVITTSSLSLLVTISGSSNVTNIKPTTWSSNMEDNENNKDVAKIPFTVTSNSKVNGTYDVTMTTNIATNSALTGGDVSDIKYKLYKDNVKVKEGSLSANFNEKVITNGVIALNDNLNDSYKLYIYIENKPNAQNILQNINFTVNLSGNANQTE